MQCVVLILDAKWLGNGIKQCTIYAADDFTFNLHVNYVKSFIFIANSLKILFIFFLNIFSGTWGTACAVQFYIGGGRERARGSQRQHSHEGQWGDFTVCISRVIFISFFHFISNWETIIRAISQFWVAGYYCRAESMIHNTTWTASFFMHSPNSLHPGLIWVHILLPLFLPFYFYM